MHASHIMFPWNEHRDKKLRELESLVRDGLRVANATLTTFTHLIKGSLQPYKALSKDAKQQKIFTLKDLEDVPAEHFASTDKPGGLTEVPDWSRPLWGKVARDTNCGDEEDEGQGRGIECEEVITGSGSSQHII